MIRTVALLFCAAAWLPAASPEEGIRLDQAGYLTAGQKLAMVAGGAAAGDFKVVRESDGKTAFTGRLTDAGLDENSGDTLRIADFSSLQKKGRYRIEAGGVKSWPFAIGDDVYGRPFYLAMRSYYAQRCGTAVDLGPEFPGFKHDACHLQGAYHASSGQSGAHVSAKGWHDAGDYGRYVVNSGISTGTLLWAYELYGQRAGRVKLNLPESGNGTPDMLNEIRWNLDWMLSMQDGDGGVFHKQTSEKFCGFVMPEKDDLPSVVVGSGKEPYKTTCASADFAAVMAMAARVFKPFDAAYSARMLAGAKKAFAWAEAHPSALYNNPQGISTGAYGDRSCGDELLWAAAELWRSTGEAGYRAYFTANYEKFLTTVRPVGPPSWASVGALGLWSYAMAKGDDEATRAIRKASLEAADAIVARTAANPYRISMTKADFIWGSNAVAANYAMQLLLAHALAPNARYVESALDNLHYLLGRNTFSLSWVTAVGTNAYKHPHHRPSGADSNAEPWPGLLSGGPNGRRQDPAMRALPELPPMKMYLDDQESYATNEVAINWNAPLVFVLAAGLR